MNINDLNIFIGVAEYESITKSAAINNTVQSNVSARIKYLEEQLGVKLLTRTTRKLELTGEGTQFLKVAKEIVNTLNDFKNTVNKNGSLTGQLKIGSLPSVASLRAPDILQRFVSEYPDMEFVLKTGTTGELIKNVLSFKLDGAFVAGKVTHPDLIVKPVIIEKLCLVSSSLYSSIEHLNKSTKPIKLIVFSKGCSYRNILEELLSETELKKLKFVEMDSLDSIIQSVENGLGITLLPEELIKKHYTYRSLTTIKIPEKYARCPTVFIRMKNSPSHKALQLFEDSIANN
ncbi:DNA-binding transcriptional LysR family regulator [Pedobacter cryoconitis]|uniref:DNA-binding transcriptional LysR family regulator n=1 Tax=Pedobacter cryoconitis TaxID=188932 RepID=A0A7W9DZ93_9SPHI|nr:LysR family transcriptional regulator [Pedobacter cryoconitis]MBB5637057.1 DNA-binding transcriptional LysR family regulator [Pedobacter cryoconitis]